MTTTRRSPNYGDEIIDVQFLVLHSTGGPLEASLDLLCNEEVGASSHLVLAEDGEVFELVPCFEDGPLKAYHAGKSEWEVDGKSWAHFNDISIGIEIVNLNGNVFEFTDAQYESLSSVVKQLQEQFPTLKDPNRIVGHEQIAGFRGKCDPGHCFDWERFYRETFPGIAVPERTPRLPETTRDRLRRFVEVVPKDSEAEFWFRLSTLMEGASL